MTAVRHTFACVGLIVLAGCFTFVMVPDSELPWLAAPSPAGKTDLPTVVIDPGHGGNDGGASANGLVEKDLTLDVAKRVAEALKGFDFPVVLTRPDDRYVSLAERAAQGNDHPDSIFISIHFNKHADDDVSGVEAFYTERKAPAEDDFSWMGIFNVKQPEPPPETGEDLASFVQTSLVLKTELRNRGIKSRGLYVTRHVRRPAALVEAGFLSNTMEAVLLKNPDYRQRLAAGIAEGILSYYRSRPAPNAPPATPGKPSGPQLVRAQLE